MQVLNPSRQQHKAPSFPKLEGKAIKGLKLNPLHRIKDARWFQILFLSSFLCFGLSFLGWENDLNRYFLTAGTCLAVQALFIKILGLSWTGLRSAAITTLSLCLLFKTYDPALIVLASTLAISSKFLIRFKGKHLFNPANFGMMFVLLFSDAAWIAPGQWGNGIIFLILVVFLGGAILNKVGRLDVGIFFLLSYGFCLFAYNCLYLGWPTDYFFHNITNGTVLIFSFFMITDPMTSPNHPKGRILWAAGIGIGAFILSQAFFIKGAPLWMLFIACPLTAYFDYVFKHKKFNWLS